MKLLHRIINKDGIAYPEFKGAECDHEYIKSLLSSPAWDGYFLKRLTEKRHEQCESLSRLKSDSVIPYRETQAKIEMLDEVISMATKDKSAIENVLNQKPDKNSK